MTARECFEHGVVQAASEHTLRLIAERGWPFWAACLVARCELEIVLRLMEADA